jgi:hypothetical protein
MIDLLSIAVACAQATDRALRIAVGWRRYDLVPELLADQNRDFTWTFHPNTRLSYRPGDDRTGPILYVEDTQPTACWRQPLAEAVPA